MEVYYERLKEKILESAVHAFPANLNYQELKRTLPEFSDVSDAEWKTAIAGLNREDLVGDEGLVSISGNTFLARVFHVELTRAGQERGKGSKELGLERAGDLLFKRTAIPLYQDFDECAANIREELAVSGTLHSTVLPTRIVQAVLERFSRLKGAFVESYVETFRNGSEGITEHREKWLKDKLDRVWAEQLRRANQLASQHS